MSQSWYIAKPLLVVAVVGLMLCHLAFFSGLSTSSESAEGLQTLQDEAALVQKDLNLNVRSGVATQDDPDEAKNAAELKEEQAKNQGFDPIPANLEGVDRRDVQRATYAKEMIPTDVSKKFAEVYANTKLVRQKFHQTVNKVGDGLNKAEEMIVVSVPSMDEVSEELANETESGKFEEVGGSVRRRRETQKKGTPDRWKKAAAELPAKMKEQKELREKAKKNQLKMLKAGAKGPEKMFKEAGNQMNDAVSQRVEKVGKVLSKWTTTTSQPTDRLPKIFGDGSAGSELTPEEGKTTQGEEDKSGSFRTTSTMLTLLLLLAMSQS